MAVDSQKFFTNETKSSSSSSSSSHPKGTTQTMGDHTFKGVGSLIKLLPSGTVFLFQFLNPLFTNNGHCNTFNKAITSVLLLLCGFSCCFSTFTDSYTGSDGKVYYGIVTKDGLWSFWDPNASKMDLSIYKLRLGDFVHSFLSLVVFAVISLLDSNSVSCFYPSFKSSEELLLKVLPVTIGGVSTFIFMVFPNKRHGIGYPATQDTSSVKS